MRQLTKSEMHRLRAYEEAYTKIVAYCIVYRNTFERWSTTDYESKERACGELRRLKNRKLCVVGINRNGNLVAQ